jgi:TrmH family RNA methyltransferase
MRALKRIESAANPRYRMLRRLIESSQARKRSGLSVLDGIHLVAAYVQQGGAPEQVVVSRAGAGHPEIEPLLHLAGSSETVVLSDALFESLSQVAAPSGIFAVVRTPRPEAVPRVSGPCVLLEGLQDPGNVGSILRTCAAAGIRQVLLSPACAHAWSPRVLRAGMGAHFALAIHEGVDLAGFARTYDGRLIATRLRAPRSLFDTPLLGNVGFLFGNEGAGLSGTLIRVAHAEVSIPMAEGAESLNVAAAAAVCLFERVRQMSAAGMDPMAAAT